MSDSIHIVDSESVSAGASRAPRPLWATHTSDVPVTVVGSTIGTHVGSGLIAVAIMLIYDVPFVIEYFSELPIL